jgi:predicted kinase
VIRKRLLGHPPEVPLPPSTYTEATARQVYEALRRKADAGLRAGHAVIVDAVSARPEERSSFSGLAAHLGIPFDGLWLQAPSATLQERVAARSGGASDATPAVVLRQLDYDTGPIAWRRIDAARDPAECLDAARSILGL